MTDRNRTFYAARSVHEGKNREKVVPPDSWQSSLLLQNGHRLIRPGQTSSSRGINLHLDDSISNLKWKRSEKIFMRKRSAPFPPALKSNGMPVR